MLSKILNYASWFFLTLFAVPSVLIVSSWNSLPGEPLYEVKLTMEQALLLLMSPSATAQGALHVKYTERRFSEAQKLIVNKQSVEGLLYLEKEIASAKQTITAAPQAERKQLAKQYVTTLQNVSGQLEQQKKLIRQTISQPTAPEHSTSQGYSPPRDLPGSTPADRHSETTSTVVTQIDDTQEEIQQTITDLQTFAPQSVTPESVPVAAPSPDTGEERRSEEHRNKNSEEEKHNQEQEQKKQ